MLVFRQLYLDYVKNYLVTPAGFVWAISKPGQNKALVESAAAKGAGIL